MSRSGSRWEAGLVFLLAVAWDLLWGEPNGRVHPVVWMGRAIQGAATRVPTGGRWLPFVGGAGIAVGGGLLFGLATAAVEQALQWAMRRLQKGTRAWQPAARAALWMVDMGLRAYLLKCTFSVRGLWHAAHAVYEPLNQDDLPGARRQLAWHLVSRDTHQLAATDVAAATIESVAENTSDSVVAPWAFFWLGGLPGAMAYRYLNTVDAMLGYRDARREWLGKAGARLDDAANLGPARLTGLLYVAAAWATGQNAGSAARVWAQDAHKTASPNAGHPMSAMAGALERELAKAEHYRLGAGSALPGVADIPRALRLYGVTVGLAGLLALLGIVWRGWSSTR